MKDPWLSNVLLNNAKDVDGNTPLHLLILRPGHQTDFYNDMRVDKMTFNKENMNALDLIGADDSEMRDKSIKYIKAETLRPGIFSYDTLHNLLWDEWRETRLSVFRYTTDSLVSLKTFGNLVERQVCRGQNRGHGILIY
ncbi:hypothetical protein ACE6H2_024910 [Prunus campanulata]